MNDTQNLFQKLKKSLLNTRKILGDNIIRLIYNNNKTIDSSVLETIKQQLLIADINIHTTQKIINNLKNHIKHNINNDIVSLYDILRNEMLKIVTSIDEPLFIKKKKPFIILTVGINGSGKTTTIGKLAYYYTLQKKNVILAAADTHRANATDQLKILGRRSGCSLVVANNTTHDPASIIFDAIQIAKLKSADLLIIDTAGRLQNKTHSMQELQKITRVIKKIDPEAPHETILIIDANIGQNSIHQVHTFNTAIKITGIIMTKLDGSAKGGVLLSIADCFTIPIRYIGVGQNIEDLQSFNSHNFINAISAKTILK